MGEIYQQVNYTLVCRQLLIFTVVQQPEILDSYMIFNLNSIVAYFNKLTAVIIYVIA